MRGSQGDFIAACREIGRELGHKGHIVLTTGDGDSTADVHIVKGLLELLINTILDSH